MPRSTVVATEEAEKRKQNRLPEIESMVPFCDLRKLHSILSLQRTVPFEQPAAAGEWVVRCRGICERTLEVLLQYGNLSIHLDRQLGLYIGAGR